MTDREKDLMRENADLRAVKESQDSMIKELRNRINELECVLAKHEEERECLSEAWKEGLRRNEILEAKLSFVMSSGSIPASDNACMANLIFGNHT